MQLIYHNFDGLDVSFQGAVPEPVLEQLREARNRAQEERRDVYAAIGPQNMPVMVAETGARGGYKYRFDTGLDGEIWFVAHSPGRDKWNLRASVKSLALALYGYEGVKSRLFERLCAGLRGFVRQLRFDADH